VRRGINKIGRHFTKKIIHNRFIINFFLIFLLLEFLFLPFSVMSSTTTTGLDMINKTDESGDSSVIVGDLTIDSSKVSVVVSDSIADSGRVSIVVDDITYDSNNDIKLVEDTTYESGDSPIVNDIPYDSIGNLLLVNNIPSDLTDNSIVEDDKNYYVPNEMIVSTGEIISILNEMIVSTVGIISIAENEVGDRSGEREIKIQKDESEIEIKSEWKQGELEDEFKVQFNTDEEPKIHLEYSSSLNTTEFELEFKVLVEEIIEYVDSNSNSRYDENDTVISSYNLNDLMFNFLDYKVETTHDNETVHIFSTNTTDGVFGIVLYAVGNFSKFDFGTLSPSEIKIDFLLNYNYLRNDSLLALKVEIKTEYETEINVESYDETQGYANNESEISILVEDYFGFFSWADYALVDGRNMPINTTVISEIDLEAENGGRELEQKDIIYFCYPRGSSIIHDPKVGVIGVSSLSFEKLLPIVSTVENILVYVITCLVTITFIIGAYT